MMSAKYLDVATASLNSRSGDIAYNQSLISEAATKAQVQGAELLLLPELCLTGYGVGDAFFYPDFLAEAEAALLALKDSLPKSLVTVFGMPIRVEGKLYNGAAVIANGEILGIKLKHAMADYGVHYESRWFSPWPYDNQSEITLVDKQIPVGDCRFTIDGVNIGIEICEDAWVEERPILQEKSLHLILNPSASHYALGKQSRRLALVTDSANAIHGAYVYCNLQGSDSGRIIYDGASFIVNDDSQIEGQCFQHGGFHLTQQSVLIADKKPLTKAIKVEGVFAFASQSSPVQAHSPLTDEEELLSAIALGLWDWQIKTRTRGFVISLSGGADSSLCAIAVFLAHANALKSLGTEGYQQVLNDLGLGITIDESLSPEQIIKTQVMPVCLTTAYQGTKHSSAQTRQLSSQLANELGATHGEWDIDDLVEGFQTRAEQFLSRQLSFASDDIALQNIQARTRSPGIWLLANVENKLLLATSNLSEAAVGYCTMDGDTSGVLSPIGGLEKTKVLRLLSAVAEGKLSLPVPELSSVQAIASQTPSAELRPEAQADETDLMPYPVLDTIREASQRHFYSEVQLMALLSERFSEQYNKNELSTWLQRYQQLNRRSQWKRERLAPSFHLLSDSCCPKSYRRWAII